MGELRYLQLEFRTSCTRCGNPVVFDGPVESTSCAFCQHPHELEGEDVAYIAKDVLGSYDSLEWKQGYAGTLNMKLHYGVYRMLPRCAACRVELDVSGIATGTRDSLHCKECGVEACTHPAPDWIRRALPVASQVFRSVVATGPSVEAAPVTIACPSCGGSLQASSNDARTIGCRFCSASVYLPDDVWQRLHPVEVARSWFLRCDDSGGLPPVEAAPEKVRKNRDAEIPEIPSGVRYGCYEPRTTCPNCGTPLVINGPRQSVRCEGCAAVHPLSGDLWYAILECADEDYAESTWREGSNSSFNRGGFAVEVGSWKLVPRCSGCRAYCDVNQVTTGTEAVLPCRECGLGMVTFPAPAWLREVYPAAAQIFGADPVGKLPGAPVTRPCPSCSAVLDLALAEQQAIACQSCGVDAFIPADLWRKLHPALQNDEWFVRFEGVPYEEVAARVETGGAPTLPDAPHRRPPPNLGSPPVRYVRMRNRTSCEHCGRPVMLNTLSETVTCSDCHETTDVSAETWSSLLESFEEGYHGMNWGQGLQGSMVSGQLDIKLQMLRSPPVCAKCETAFDVADLPTGTVSDIPCTACGAKLSTWPVPEWLRAFHPSAEQVFGGAPETTVERGSAEITGVRPVVVECDHCGAALRIGRDSPRDVQCEMCRTRSLLPEGVWRRLHPVRKVESWWLRLRGATHRELEATREKSEQVERTVPAMQGAWLLTLLLTLAALAFGVSILMHAAAWTTYVAFGAIVASFLLATFFQHQALSEIGDGSDTLEVLLCAIPGIGAFFISRTWKATRGIERTHGVPGRLSIALGIQLVVGQLSGVGFALWQNLG